MSDEERVTQWLHQVAKGDQHAFDELAAWAYSDLERLAARRMRRRFGAGEGQLTLEPAGLVNETFLKLLRNPRGFENRRHFLAFANQVMMRVLIDYQRARAAEKRGGEAIRVTLSGLGADRGAEIDLIDFEQALEQLAELDARKAEVVRLRLMWGMELREIAEILEISVPTVERDWRFAKSWLAETLGLEP